MFYKFSTINCRSRCNGEKQDQRASFHSFPSNSSNLVGTTSKKNYIPTKHSKLCSLHFKSEEDFVTDSTDQKTRRKRKRETFSLIRRQRRKDACPLIFKNLPSCYTHNDHLVRSGLSTTSFRFENKAARIEEQNKIF